MKIVVFGASGGVGSHVIQQALERGHAVRAVYRGALIPGTGRYVEVRWLSNFFDRYALAQVIAGTDAVISCLGARRTNPRNPWSKITSPLDLIERFSNGLVEAMTTLSSPRRLVILSAAGVGTSASLLHPILRFVFEHSTVGPEYRDLAKMEGLVERSNLDWTIVQPVTLTNGPPTNKVRICSYYSLTDSIARADVASFMLRSLEETISARQRRSMIYTNDSDIRTG